MTEDMNQPASPAPEVLTDIGDGPSTPLQHKNPEATPEPEAPKAPKSASEAIKAAMAKVESEGSAERVGEKAAEKAETKAAPADEAAAAKEVGNKAPDEAGGVKAETASQSEGKHINAPSRLLPSERDVWVNTPRAVQGAFERIERELEASANEHKDAVEFRESLREYDEIAKKYGSNLPSAFKYYHELETKMRSDPANALAEIIRGTGRNPVEMVAQIMRTSGVLPQQLGAYLNGQPAQQQQQQRAPQVDPAAQAALQRVEQLEAALTKQAQERAQEAQRQEIHARIIAPAMAEMPRFKELEGDIAFFLNSGRIPSSLSPDARLREAYFAADRLNPALRSAPDPAVDPDEKVASFAAKKSISGAPGKSSTASGKPKILSVRESIELASRSHA